MSTSTDTSSTQGRTVAVSGASGMIGAALVKRLQQAGHTVVPIVRRPPEDGSRAIHWDQTANHIDAKAMAGVDAVVHLAGETIMGRWTAAKKQRIRQSRVDGTGLLARTIAALEPKPSVLISASGIHVYGDRGDTLLDEEASPPDTQQSFLTEVGMAWEAAAQPAREAGIRVVHPRIGMVLSREGGALAAMRPVFRMGAGGVMGSGQQWVSWIHLDDLLSIIERMIDDDQLIGPVNAVAPEPVTNRQMTKLLGKALGRPTVLPVPAFAARLALGEMADELLLTSQRVVPRRMQALDFQFAYPRMDDALSSLLS